MRKNSFKQRRIWTHRKNSPGQSPWLHDKVWWAGPRHSWPPLDGAGLLQNRCLSWTPCPQDFEQVVQLPQALHPPSTMKTPNNLLAQLAEFNTCSIAVAEQWQGWQGWRSGESTCLPPMWPGFDFRTRRQMWIEFVGSLLCYERFFPGTPVFPSPQKPTFDLISFDL